MINMKVEHEIRACFQMSLILGLNLDLNCLKLHLLWIKSDSMCAQGSNPVPGGNCPIFSQDQPVNSTRQGRARQALSLDLLHNALFSEIDLPVQGKERGPSEAP